MADLSGKRVVPYVVAGLLVAAVGFWGLRGGIAAGPESAATVVSVVPAGGAQAGVTGRGSVAVPGGTGEAPVATTTTMIYVQVAGAVGRPGVYEVEPGARVFQVILQAGGMASDADEDAVPLAAAVVDGGRIWVPRIGDPPGLGAVADPGAMSGGVAGAGPEAGAKIVLSTATLAELDTLPGVGPKTAQQIIAHREQSGPFTSVDQLEEVPGIGPTTVERLRDLVVP